jgi:hypothetical protein
MHLSPPHTIMNVSKNLHFALSVGILILAASISADAQPATSAAAAGKTPVLIDELGDLTHIDSSSGDWGQSGGLPDTTALTRKHNTSQFIVYKQAQVTGFAVTVYCTPFTAAIANDDVNVQVSPDGVSWSSVAIQKGALSEIPEVKWNAWKQNSVRNLKRLPAGSNFIRFELPPAKGADGKDLPDTEAWRVSLGRVELFADAHEAEPVYDFAMDATTPALNAGVARLGFKKSATGYGMVLAENGRVVAFEECPVQLFYEKLGSGITRRGFDTLQINGNSASLSAHFTDDHKNTWLVALKISASGANGFSGRYDYQLVTGTATNVFLMAPLSVRTSQEDSYLLMPGIMYDGNNRDFQTAAVKTDESQVNYPKIDAIHDYKIETPATSLATPAIGLYDKQSGQSLFYSTKDIGLCGAEGFIYRKYGPNDCHQAVIITPCYREVLFKSGYPPQPPSPPIGANMTAGDQRHLNILLSTQQHKSLAEFIRSFRDVRDSVRNMAARIQNIPFSAAARLIEEYFNKRKWLEDKYYCNVVLCGQDLKGQPNPAQGWNLMTGWCDGTMTAYALLDTGDPTTRARAIKMMDFMCEDGISKSGLFKSCYDGPAVGWNGSPWGERARMFTDAAYYLAKAIIAERMIGKTHPKWEAALKSNLDALTKLWAENHDFGHMVNTETGKISENGTASGSRAIGVLALGATIFKDDNYRKIAAESADAYYNRHIKTGYTNGGPHDISKAPDAESNTALLESFVNVYALTKDARFLTYAREAADLFATWVVGYDGVVPENSVMGKLKIQTTGGVLANTRNHHIGPSACTSSVASLIELYFYTGDSYYLQLLKEIASGVPQYVTRKQGDAGSMEPGMITEQVNITDEIAPPGSLWELSATWPETGMFLTRLEVPSVLVDFKARTTTVFDQLEAKTNFASKSVTITNNTPYDASVRVMNEKKKSIIVEVPKSQSREVRF